MRFQAMNHRNLPRSRRQGGFTLVELLIAVVISLIAVSGMVIVMGNVVGTTNQVIQQTRLAGDMRAAMQVVVRDLRRANFNEAFASCIGAGNLICTAVPDNTTIDTGNNCMSYSYRRRDTSGNWQNVSGSVRLSNNQLQFNSAQNNCAASAGWEPLTDPDIVQITGFAIQDTGDPTLTYEASGVTPTLSQRVRKMRITMTGRVCEVGGLSGCTSWRERQVQTTVRVRNDLLFVTPTP